MKLTMVPIITKLAMSEKLSAANNVFELVHGLLGVLSATSIKIAVEHTPLRLRTMTQSKYHHVSV